MADLSPERLRFSCLAWGIAAVTLLLASAAVVMVLVQDGPEAALHPDAGGGAAMGITLLVGGFGMVFGLGLTMISRAIAPRSWIVALIALAIFCTLGGRFNASPVFQFDHWLEGALFSLGYAVAAIGAGAGLQWLAGLRRRRTPLDR